MQLTDVLELCCILIQETEQATKTLFFGVRGAIFERDEFCDIVASSVCVSLSSSSHI